MDICPTAEGKKEGKRDCGLLLAVAGRRVKRSSVSCCPHSECEKRGRGYWCLRGCALRSVPRRGGPKRGDPLHAPNELRFTLENDFLSPKKTEVGGPLENCGF